MTQMKLETRTLTNTALFAALTAVCSQILVPLPFTPVPVNLAVLAVLLAAFLQGRYTGAISMAVYVLLGAFGMPVFAGMRGGFSVLIGPTGGYIFGYVAMAVLIGFLKKDVSHSVHNTVLAFGGVGVCYAVGTAWFMLLTGNSLWQSLLLCVIPFVLGDVAKVLLAMLVYTRLAKVTKMFS